MSEKCHKQTLAAKNAGEFLEIGNGTGDSTTQEPQSFHGRAGQAALTSPLGESHDSITLHSVC
jgi:hypothetical protein